MVRFSATYSLGFSFAESSLPLSSGVALLPPQPAATRPRERRNASVREGVLINVIPALS